MFSILKMFCIIRSSYPYCLYYYFESKIEIIIHFFLFWFIVYWIFSLDNNTNFHQNKLKVFTRKIVQLSLYWTMHVIHGCSFIACSEFNLKMSNHVNIFSWFTKTYCITTNLAIEVLDNFPVKHNILGINTNFGVLIKIQSRLHVL